MKPLVILAALLKVEAIYHKTLFGVGFFQSILLCAGPNAQALDVP